MLPLALVSIVCALSAAEAHAGDASGVEAGDASGVEAGDASGVEAGDASGVEAGDASGVEAGDASALEAGDAPSSFDGSAAAFPAIPQIVGAVARCVHDADCTSNHCVDGVCCDTPCTERCHSCAQLAAPGLCMLEPAGVDLRNECGALDTCTGTCGADGACVAAGPGAMCAKNYCTGKSTGSGPAYCAAAGAACSDAGVVAFDCSPYACAPAFGACLTSCASNDDCIEGFTCEADTKACVPAASPTSSGGCAAGGAPSSAGIGVFAMSLAIGAVRRRRTRGRPC